MLKHQTIKDTGMASLLSQIRNHNHNNHNNHRFQETWLWNFNTQLPQTSFMKLAVITVVVVMNPLKPVKLAKK